MRVGWILSRGVFVFPIHAKLAKKCGHVLYTKEKVCQREKLGVWVCADHPQTDHRAKVLMLNSQSCSANSVLGSFL